MIDALHSLYDHNRKATERLLDTAEKLPQAQLMAPQTAGRGSTRDTLVHMVGGQRLWLTVWGGALPPGEAARQQVNNDDFPDVAAIRAFFHVVDGATQDFLGKLQPATLEEPRTRRMGDGREVTLPLWQMMLHVPLHCMQHRSEVAAFLTAFGHSPGELGMLTFLPGR